MLQGESGKIQLLFSCYYHTSTAECRGKVSVVTAGQVAKNGSLQTFPSYIGEELVVIFTLMPQPIRFSLPCHAVPSQHT